VPAPAPPLALPIVVGFDAPTLKFSVPPPATQARIVAGAPGASSRVPAVMATATVIASAHA